MEIDAAKKFVKGRGQEEVGVEEDMPAKQPVTPVVARPLSAGYLPSIEGLVIVFLSLCQIDVC